MHGHGGPRLAHQMSHQKVETSIWVSEDPMRSLAPGIDQKNRFDSHDVWRVAGACATLGFAWRLP